MFGLDWTNFYWMGLIILGSFYPVKFQGYFSLVLSFCSVCTPPKIRTFSGTEQKNRQRRAKHLAKVNLAHFHWEKNVTESWNNRMLWVGRDFKGHLVQTFSYVVWCPNAALNPCKVLFIHL